MMTSALPLGRTITFIAKRALVTAKPLSPPPSTIQSAFGTTWKWTQKHKHHRCFSAAAESHASPLINSMKLKIKDQLNAQSVTVTDAYGDGRHVSISVVSEAFQGKSQVSRQRMVYKAIWEELQTTVHAVDHMSTKTPQEAATSTSD